MEVRKVHIADNQVSQDKIQMIVSREVWSSL